MTTTEELKVRDGFMGSKQIIIPSADLVRHLNLFYVTQIGYYPRAKFHYRLREEGCEDYLLIYCVDGKGHYETKNGTFTVTSNQFILLPPHEFHCYQADIENPWSIYWIHFTGSNIQDFHADLNLEKFGVPTNLPFNDKILNIWQEMFSSISESFNSQNQVYANLCLYRFLSFFIFPNLANKVKTEEVKKDQFDQSIMYMTENIHRKLTAEDIANEFNFSVSHYSALFKRKTGLSPIDYFIRIKIRYACQLLTQSDLIIKEVAEKIGYDDPYYFSRIFKKVSGKSPLEYKRIHGRTEGLMEEAY